jgi:glycosyltransferase involved in cell wall biosynthesis
MQSNIQSIEIAGAREAGEVAAKPRVLYIITRSIRGGAQSHLFDLATAMKDDFDIHLAVGEEGFLTEACREHGIPVHILPHLQRRQNAFSEISCFWETLSLLKRIRPDLIHAHTFKAGFIARLAGWWLGIPTIYTVHAWLWGTEEVSRAASALGRPLEQLAAHWCDRIIAVSDAGASLLRKSKVGTSGKIVTIYNGIPDCVERAESHSKRELVIVMVARFTPAKDHEVLLKAFAGIPAGPLLWLIGEGETRKKFEEMAQGLGIHDRVDFMGVRADVPHLLANADIFVLSSVSEQFPISILEAMRAGLPVIASNVGGVREAIIDGETGILVPSGSIDALREALLRLLRDAELRAQLGREARDQFVMKFMLSSMKEKSKHVYLEVLRENSV